MRSIKLDAFVKGREGRMILWVKFGERARMYVVRRGVVVI